MADAADEKAAKVYDSLNTGNYLKDLRKFESHPNFPDGVPYMYSDSEGYITVGVGHNLSANGTSDVTFLVKRTTRYSFMPRKGVKFKTGLGGTSIASNERLGQVAGDDEVKNDFDFLVEHLGGRKNNYSVPNMQKYTTLELEPAEIERLFKQDVISHVKQAATALGDRFYTFPLSAQAAILDIDFNVKGGIGSFRELTAAIKGVKTAKKDYSILSASQRWELAAGESNRGQVDKTRNDTIKQWFLDASKETKGETTTP